MRFNGRIAGMSAGVTAVIYMMLPNIDEGRGMQVITFASLWLITSMLIGWIADELVRIQRKRNNLDIRSKRPSRGNRDGLKTDIRFKKKSWVITFPAEKVER